MPLSFDLRKILFAGLLGVLGFFALFNLVFGLFLPYRALKKDLHAQMLRQGLYIMSRFDSTVDELNNIYIRLMYNLYSKGISKLDNLSTAYIDTQLFEKEMMAAPVIHSVQIYNRNSPVYYDSLEGLKTFDPSILEGLPPGLSRNKEALFYTGIADTYINSSLVISFRINENFLKSTLLDEEIKVLFSVTDDRGRLIVGNHTLLENLAPSLEMGKLKINGVNYLRLARKSPLKNYYTQLLVPVKKIFGKIHKQMAVSAVIYLILTLFLFILYRILFIQTMVKTHVRITEKTLMVNDRNYGNLLAPRDLQILHFLSGQPFQKANCSEIQKNLCGKVLPDCACCARVNTKASLCPTYKKTYNQILKIKKIMEALNIGTIETAKNKQNILDKGWTLNWHKKVNFHDLPPHERNS